MNARHHIALALAAAIGLGGCDVAGSGGGDIPPNAAAGLQGALSDLEGAVEADSCSDARDAVALFRERADALQDVEQATSERLEAGAGRLETLVQDGVCAQEEDVETTTTTTTTEEEPTTTEPEEKPEKDKEKKEGEEGGGPPPEGEKGPNAPPGPEGNEDEGGTGDDSGTSDDSGTGGVGDAGVVSDPGVTG